MGAYVAIAEATGDPRVRAIAPNRLTATLRIWFRFKSTGPGWDASLS